MPRKWGNLRNVVEQVDVDVNRVLTATTFRLLIVSAEPNRKMRIEIGHR